MAEYIERGGKLFPTPFSSEEHGDYRQGWNHCLRAIYQMPAADVVERKKGKWERNKNNGLLYCPFCDSVAPAEDQHGETITRPPFCHQCGGDLREDTT